MLNSLIVPLSYEQLSFPPQGRWKKRHQGDQEVQSPGNETVILALKKESLCHKVAEKTTWLGSMGFVVFPAIKTRGRMVPDRKLFSRSCLRPLFQVRERVTRPLSFVAICPYNDVPFRAWCRLFAHHSLISSMEKRWVVSRAAEQD